MPDIPKKSRFRSTAEIRAEQRDEDTTAALSGEERRIELLLMELKLYGFACVKEIANLRGEKSGTMECPMCGQPLRFSIAASNGHCASQCTRKGCIKAME